MKNEKRNKVLQRLHDKLDTFLEIDQLEKLSEDDLEAVINRVVLDNWKSNLIEEATDVQNRKQKHRNEIIQRLRERQDFKCQLTGLNLENHLTAITKIDPYGGLEFENLQLTHKDLEDISKKLTNEQIIEYSIAILLKNGYEVKEAKTGKDATDALQILSTAKTIQNSEILQLSLSVVKTLGKSQGYSIQKVKAK